MYRLSLCLFLSISFLSPIAAQETVNPFAKQIDVGVQIVAGSAINDAIGFQARSHYRFHEKGRAGINYTHYFDGFDASLSQKVIEWNLDGHYIFINNEENITYILAGFNYTKSTEVLEALSYSEVGWNIGAGGRFGIGEQLAATAEIKYTVSNANQLVLGLGVAYIFE